jgi:guanylate kinase
MGTEDGRGELKPPPSTGLPGGGSGSEVSYDEWRRPPNPLLVVISGPSGVGKDAVIRRMKQQGCPFHFVVTATTRPPREGEVDGVDYVFVSDRQFESWVRDGELLEHALVYGQHKGIPKAQVREALESGRDVVMRLDVQGAATVRALLPGAVLIFLVPHSERELLDRLRRRGTESPLALQRRMQTLRDEMLCIPEFDYVVENPDGRIDEAVAKIKAIISAEKCRTRQRAVSL